MYCPKCSQHQISDEVRFCNRCGFQLKVVSELLKTDGEIPLSLFQTADRAPVSRRRGRRVGAKLMFVSLVLMLPALFVSLVFDNPTPLVLPILLFFIGTAMVLYRYLFGNPPAAETPAAETPALLGRIKAKLNLSAGESVPITTELKRNEDFPHYQSPARQEVNINYPPPSVTEHTTKFLDEK